jgi:hypothetical protein
VRNALQLHLMNKRAAPDSYRVEVDPVEGMTVLLPMTIVVVPALGDVRVPMFLSVPRDRFQREFSIRVHVVHDDNRSGTAIVTGTFLGPSS